MTIRRTGYRESGSSANVTRFCQHPAALVGINISLFASMAVLMGVSLIQLVD